MISKHVIEYFKELDISQKLTFSNIPRCNNYNLTHAYHRYPAKFIPALAHNLIIKNSHEGEVVCDPFGGCGTTLVEAKSNGRRSVGIDINPLAGLISKTKITVIEPEKLQRETHILIYRIGKIKHTHLVKNTRLDYWFDEKTRHNLQDIYDAILLTKESDTRRFFLCAFSHILKNCSRWLMKSIKPTIDKNKKPIDSYSIFTKHLSFMVKKNQDFYNKLRESGNESTESKFYVRDARKTGLAGNSVDYILTSPPYVTSYEYADLHQLGLLWFTNINNWVDFKRKFIGTSHRNNRNIDFYSSLGNEIVRDLEYNDRALSRSVRTYYEDMYYFIVESKRILKKGKKMSLVIGDTNLKGVDILNAEVAFEQMQALGFRRLHVDKRQTSSQSITPYRDIPTGRFTSVKNPNKRRAYQYEYIITGVNS